MFEFKIIFKKCLNVKNIVIEPKQLKLFIELFSDAIEKIIKVDL